MLLLHESLAQIRNPHFRSRSNTLNSCCWQNAQKDEISKPQIVVLELSAKVEDENEDESSFCNAYARPLLHIAPIKDGGDEILVMFFG